MLPAEFEKGEKCKMKKSNNTPFEFAKIEIFELLNSDIIVTSLPFPEAPFEGEEDSFGG